MYKLFWLRFILLLVSINCFSFSSDIQKNEKRYRREVFTKLDYSPNECVVRHGKDYYDFSDLASRKFWSFSAKSLRSEQFDFLLSVCHAIPADVPCEGNSGVCFKVVSNSSAQVNYTSGGVLGAKLQPNFISDGSFEYTYESGSVCQIGQVSSTYRTTIHFKCTHPDYKESPEPILVSAPRCAFIFIWMTRAACPLKVEQDSSDPCIVRLSNNSTLNLHSMNLKNSYYKVRDGEFLEASLCGRINNSSCSNSNTTICYTGTEKESTPLVTTNSHMEIMEISEALVISYLNDSSNFTINLQCSDTAFEPWISSFVYVNRSYTLTVKTAVLCLPKEINCVLTDKSLKTYDLRSLHKLNKNWEIGGSGEEKGASFMLNICGSVNDEDQHCPLGPVGMCQTREVEGKTVGRSLGYATSNPEINVDGTISFVYTGGEQCEKTGAYASTTITLYCSSREYQPVIVNVIDSCHYFVEFRTPAACPLKSIMTAISSSCEVQDPLYRHTFDFNPLRNNTNDLKFTSSFIDGSEDETVEVILNICGPLLTQCDGMVGNVSICLIDGEEEVVAGYTQPVLTFNDGTIVMKFGDKIHNHDHLHFSTSILFLCDYTDEEISLLLYKEKREGEKENSIIWRTKRACPPISEVSCSLTDGDLRYDLSPLAHTSFGAASTEAMVLSSGRSGYRYFINVCRPVFHTAEARCPYDAAVCAVDIVNKTQAVNMGKVVNGPYKEDGLLKLKYSSGDVCNATHRYEAEIIFTCSEDKDSYEPILVNEETCFLVFEWRTFYACPLKDRDTENIEPALYNCTAINPTTQYVYDMSSLQSSRPYEISMPTGLLLLNICGPIEDSRCSVNNAGSCFISNQTTGDQPRKSSSGGIYSTNLQFKKWSVFLDFKDGDACPNGNSRSTQVSFFCDTVSSLSEEYKPLFIKEEDEECTYIIHFPTPLACERQVSCVARNWEKSWDMSPLIRKDGNYVMRNPNSTEEFYMINICRPLKPVRGMHCPGSASCLLNSKTNTSSGLGFPLISPSIVGEDVFLMYPHGSACPDSGGMMTTKIRFKCREDAGLGHPVYETFTHDCQLQILWETDLVCESYSSTPGAQCTIGYDKAKTNVDLKALFRPNGYVVPFQNRTFVINVCGDACPKPGTDKSNCSCKDSAVCENGMSYGKTVLSELKWDYDALQLAYFNGDSCEGALSGKKSARIFFECDISVGYGFPEPDSIMADVPCTALFNWKTNVTCLEAIYGHKTTAASFSPTTASPTPVIVITSPQTPEANDDSTSFTERPEVPEAAPPGDSASTVLSITISMVVILIIGLCLLAMALRAPYIRRWFLNAKRSFRRKGDEILILDDDIGL